MTDQTNDEPFKLTEEQKLADAETRRVVAIQLDETEKRAREKKEKRLTGMSDPEFRDYIRERFGYDPI